MDYDLDMEQLVEILRNNVPVLNEEIKRFVPRFNEFLVCSPRIHTKYYPLSGVAKIRIDSKLNLDELNQIGDLLKKFFGKEADIKEIISNEPGFKFVLTYPKKTWTLKEFENAIKGWKKRAISDCNNSDYASYQRCESRGEVEAYDKVLSYFENLNPELFEKEGFMKGD